MQKRGLVGRRDRWIGLLLNHRYGLRNTRKTAFTDYIYSFGPVSKTPCITGMFFWAKAPNQVPPFSSQGDM